ILHADIYSESICAGIWRRKISIGIMHQSNASLYSEVFEEILFIVIQHQIGGTQKMAAVSVIFKISFQVKRIGVVSNSLPYSEENIPLQKVKIEMPVQAIIFTQNIVMRILMNKGKTPIGVIIFLLPTLGSISFSVET